MTWKPDYATTQLVGDYLHVPADGDSAFLATWITAVSRNIDSHCGRQFGTVAAPVTRYYDRPVYDWVTGYWVYTVDDLYDTTGLTVLDTSGNTVVPYGFEPLNALADGVPYERLVVSTAVCGRGGRIAATSQKWGWATVPASITEGLLLFANRLSARRDSPFGVAGSPSDGSELRLLAKLDPDMITVLKPFRRTWWGVA